MKDKTLLALVKKAAKGDKRAFAQLCEQKVGQVLFLCARELGDWHDGQDAAQEVFIRMQKAIGGLRSAEAFNVWLNRIIVSTCHDMRRQTMKQTQLEYSPDMQDAVLAGALDSLPQHLVESEENRRLLMELVDGLPLHYRQCLLLHYYERLSYEAIAQVLDIKPDAVNHNLRMARRVLKAELEEQLGTGSLAGRGSYSFVGFGAAFASMCQSTEAEMVTPAMKRLCLQAAGVQNSGFLGLLPTKKSAVLLSCACAACIAGAVILPTLFNQPASAPQPVPGTPAGATQGPSVVSGTILDTEAGSLAARVLLHSGGAGMDRALQGVTLRLVALDGEGYTLEAQSGPDGGILFQTLPEGTYQLELQLPEDVRLAETAVEEPSVYTPGEVFVINAQNAQAETVVLLHAPAVLQGRINAPLSDEGVPLPVPDGQQVGLRSGTGEVVATTTLHSDYSFAFEPLALEQAAEYTLFALGDESAFPIAEQAILLYPGYGYSL